MSALLVRYGIIYALIAAFLVARPWLSRRNVLFGGVFGDDEIWAQAVARKIIRRFVWANLLVAVAVAAVVTLTAHALPPNEIVLTHLYVAAVFALLILDMAPYIWANLRMKTLKGTLPNGNLVKNRITVEIGGADSKNEPLSAAWFLLLLVPVAVAILLAVIYYPGLPAQIAVHFAGNGVADGWAAKSVGLIIGPVFKQMILVALIMCFIGILSRSAPASVKGSPGAAPGYPAFRRLISILLIAVSLVVEAGYLLTELAYLGIARSAGRETAIITGMVAVLVIVLFVAFFQLARNKRPSGDVLDDDEKWILGGIYFNPADPSLFVEKRSGIGRTLNFGRPVAWVILGVIVLFIAFRLIWNK